MKRYQWFVIGKLLTFSFFPSQAQEFPLHIMEEGHIIIQLKVNGGLTGNFILDTGAGTHVVSGKFFEKLKDSAVQKGYFTGFRHDGDRLDGPVYQIPSLSIGKYRQSDPIIGVYPPLDDYGIDGLLSLKFFEDKVFAIDFKEARLTFLDQAAVEEISQNALTLPLQLYQHTDILLDIFIPIIINNQHEIWAEFDTGSGYGSIIIHPNYIKDWQLEESTGTTQAYRTQLSQETREDQIFPLSAIALGQGDKALKQSQVKAIFREGLIYNALLGSGLFKEKKICIDIPGRRFMVK